MCHTFVLMSSGIDVVRAVFSLEGTLVFWDAEWVEVHTQTRPGSPSPGRVPEFGPRVLVSMGACPLVG